MMNLWQAILLGLLQGVTEFLPVSSSGHLVLVQQIFGISEPVLFFDTWLHLGTLAAVILVLRREVAALLRRPFQRLTALLAAATLPTVILALLFKDIIEGAFNSGYWLGGAFLVTALALALGEGMSRRRAGKGAGEKKDLTFGDALLIGTLQGVAILPGVSRSGLTLTGAISRGVDRDYGARFSFLLAIPAILGALVFQARELMAAGGLSGAAGISGGISAGCYILGFLAAALSGAGAVGLMLKIVRERSLWGFSLYTGLLGGAVLLAAHFNVLGF